MPIQRLEGPSGSSNLNVGGSYGRSRYGGKSRDFGNAQALSDLLGVATNFISEQAQEEKQEAFQRGIDARISGVRQENANDAAKGIFAPLFKGAAGDGFDYQDAQYNAPQIILDESTAMLELQASDDPKDFQQFIAAQDAKLQESLEDRSPVYRRAVMGQLAAARRESVKTFATWMTANREQKRRDAASAQVSSLVSTIGDPGERNAALKSFLDDAPERLNMSHTDARAVVAGELIAAADRKNSPEILESLDLRMFTTEQKKALTDAADEMWGERRSRITAGRQDQAYARSEQERATKRDFNAQLVGVFGQTMDGAKPWEAIEQLRNHPYLANNPEALTAAVGKLQTMHTATVNPFVEAQAVAEAQQRMITGALGNKDPMEIAADVAANGDIRSANYLSQLGQWADTAQKVAQSYSTDFLGDYYTDIEQTFPMPSASSSSPTSAKGMAEEAAFGAPEGPAGYPASLATDAKEQFNKYLGEYVYDWYQQNPEHVGPMPRSEKLTLARQAREEAVAWGEQQAGIIFSKEPSVTTSTSGSIDGPSTALDRLNAKVSGQEVITNDPVIEDNPGVDTSTSEAPTVETPGELGEAPDDARSPAIRGTDKQYDIVKAEQLAGSALDGDKEATTILYRLYLDLIGKEPLLPEFEDWLKSISPKKK